MKPARRQDLPQLDSAQPWGRTLLRFVLVFWLVGCLVSVAVRLFFDVEALSEAQTIAVGGGALGLGLIVAIADWRAGRRRRRVPGTCRSCGYNLTGNVSGVCPECGTTLRGRFPPP